MTYLSEPENDDDFMFNFPWEVRTGESRSQTWWSTFIRNYINLSNKGWTEKNNKTENSFCGAI